MNKQLSLLFIIAVLAIGGGLWLTHNAKQRQAEPELLFKQGLDKAATISAVSLQNSQGNLLKAQLVNGRWMAKFDRFSANYPLDKAKLAALIKTLVQAKLVEAKTSKAENYHHLGLESIDNVDSLATLVSITFSDSPSQWQVLVGSKATVGQGSYVRMPQQTQSWQVDHTIDLPQDKFSWLQRPILNLKDSDVESVSRIDDHPWSISKDEKGEFTLNALPAGRELRYPGVVSGMVSSLLNLDFDALIPLDDEAWQQAKLVASLNIKTTEDKNVLVKVMQLDNDYAVQFSSEQMKDDWLNWTYQISNFNAQQLTKSLDDFLAELPKKQPTKIPVQEVEEGDSPQ